MDEKHQLSMLAHWIGTYILDARLALDDGNSIEVQRDDLVKKLEGLGKHPVIDYCVDYLRQHEWSSVTGIDSFQRKYDEAVGALR